jgi:hypothetical protein
VISNAATGRSNVLGLVYAAGFAPDQGDTILNLGEGFQPSEAFNVRQDPGARPRVPPGRADLAD